jgi:hypothetical protein
MMDLSQTIVRRPVDHSIMASDSLEMNHEQAANQTAILAYRLFSKSVGTCTKSCRHHFLRQKTGEGTGQLY